jgi:hypothetical protein
MIQRKTLPTQLHTGKRPLKGRFETPVNYGSEGRRSGYMKPVGGLWTSTWETAFTEGWPSWVLGEEFHVEQLDQAWLLEPVECNVIELAGFDQCHEFLKRYGKQLYSMPRNEGVPPPGASLPYPFDGVETYEDSPYGMAYSTWDTPSAVCPVWEDVQQDADCVRLLTPYAMDVRLGPYLCFYGWDCESTIWLRWKFKGAARRVSLDAMRNRMEEGAAA